jgi:hypothetical protein
MAHNGNGKWQWTPEQMKNFRQQPDLLVQNVWNLELEFGHYGPVVDKDFVGSLTLSPAQIGLSIECWRARMHKRVEDTAERYLAAAKQLEAEVM